MNSLSFGVRGVASTCGAACGVGDSREAVETDDSTGRSVVETNGGL